MPRPRTDLRVMRPPISWIFRRTTSMPTPRPEMSDNDFRRRKSWQKDEVVHLVLGERGLGTDKPLLLCFLEHAVGVDAGAVIADFDDDASSAMLGCHPDRSLIALASC